MTAPPLPEWELWACANATLQQHGEDAALFVAMRMGELALKGDGDGVATWKAIARCIVRLQDTPEDAAKH